MAPKLAWPGVRDPISKFWDPLNISQTGEATIFKFGTHIGRGQFLPPDHKLAPSIQVKLKIASKEDHDCGVDPWRHLKVNDSQVKVTMSMLTIKICHIVVTDEAMTFKFATQMDSSCPQTTQTDPSLYELRVKWPNFEILEHP